MESPSSNRLNSELHFSKVEAELRTNPENLEVERTVRFKTVVSCVLFTLEIPSRSYRLPAGESAFQYGLPYSLISLALGWWAFPWGPLRTWEALESNRTGSEEQSS